MSSKVPFMLIAQLLVHPAALAQVAPPAQTPSSMSRAAGMPLQVGDLAPGILTVRVVRGAFTGNIAGQVVEVNVDDNVRQASTDSNGRAQFAHLAVGSRVHVTASIGSERLESEVFTMPADGGIRVLLVANEEGAPGPGTGDATRPGQPATTDVAAVATPTTATADDLFLVKVAVTGTAAIGVAAVLLLPRWRRRPR